MLNRSTTLPCLALLLPASLALPARSHAQARPAAEETAISATTAENGPVGIVPFVHGVNFSLTTSSEHDSADGWSSVVTPDLAYRFNGRFSVDAGTPIYDYLNTEVTGGTKARPVYTEKTEHFVASDTALNGHMELNPALLSYNLTTTLGLPTGSKADGLGAGQVTYNVNNHFEKSFSMFTPDLELGLGDSSDLLGTRVRKSYTTVGTLAYFQTGTSVSLPRRVNFSADAYEALPLTSQTVLSTTGKGRKKVTTSTQRSEGEDNGFLTALDIPLSGHVTLSGFYNRSLRNHLDTAGFSFTVLMKAPPRNVQY